MENVNNNLNRRINLQRLDKQNQEANQEQKLDEQTNVQETKTVQEFQEQGEKLQNAQDYLAMQNQVSVNKANNQPEADDLSNNIVKKRGNNNNPRNVGGKVGGTIGTVVGGIISMPVAPIGGTDLTEEIVGGAEGVGEYVGDKIGDVAGAVGGAVTGTAGKVGGALSSVLRKMKESQAERIRDGEIKLAKAKAKAAENKENKEYESKLNQYNNEKKEIDDKLDELNQNLAELENEIASRLEEEINSELTKLNATKKEKEEEAAYMEDVTIADAEDSLTGLEAKMKQAEQAAQEKKLKLFASVESASNALENAKNAPLNEKATPDEDTRLAAISGDLNALRDELNKLKGPIADQPDEGDEDGKRTSKFPSGTEISMGDLNRAGIYLSILPNVVFYTFQVQENGDVLMRGLIYSGEQDKLYENLEKYQAGEDKTDFKESEKIVAKYTANGYIHPNDETDNGGVAAPGDGGDDDPSKRIEELEKQIKALNDEINIINSKIAARAIDEHDAAVAAAQKAYDEAEKAYDEASEAYRNYNPENDRNYAAAKAAYDQEVEKCNKLWESILSTQNSLQQILDQIEECEENRKNDIENDAEINRLNEQKNSDYENIAKIAKEIEEENQRHADLLAEIEQNLTKAENAAWEKYFARMADIAAEYEKGSGSGSGNSDSGTEPTTPTPVPSTGGTSRGGGRRRGGNPSKLS